MKKSIALFIALFILTSFLTAFAWNAHSAWCNICRAGRLFAATEEYRHDDTNHYPVYRCTTCESYVSVTNFESAPHEGGTATCTKQAVCTVCGFSYGAVPGHYYGAWTSNGDGTHCASCVRCNESRISNCDCRDGEFCFVCGSGEFELIVDATAKGARLPARGELCVRYAPEKGFLISWEYCGAPVTIPAPLTVSVPVEIEGDFAIADMDYTYENRVLTLTITEDVTLVALK